MASPVCVTQQTVKLLRFNFNFRHLYYVSPIALVAFYWMMCLQGLKMKTATFARRVDTAHWLHYTRGRKAEVSFVYCTLRSEITRQCHQDNLGSAYSIAQLLVSWQFSCEIRKNAIHLHPTTSTQNHPQVVMYRAFCLSAGGEARGVLPILRIPWPHGPLCWWEHSHSWS